MLYIEPNKPTVNVNHSSSSSNRDGTLPICDERCKIAQHRPPEFQRDRKRHSPRSRQRWLHGLLCIMEKIYVRGVVVRRYSSLAELLDINQELNTDPGVVRVMPNRADGARAEMALDMWRTLHPPCETSSGRGCSDWCLIVTYDSTLCPVKTCILKLNL